MGSSAVAVAGLQPRPSRTGIEGAPPDHFERTGWPLWLLIVAFALGHLLLAALLPLTPQEAYYWLWSRELAWSYFDHPPLAAYSIALTTALLGSTAFGIKCAAVAWSFVLSVLWARLILDFGWGQRTAFWSLLAINLVGIVAAYGIVIAPDAPLLAAWVATLWAVWRAARTGQGRWWILGGACLGLALLAKYTAILLVPAVGLFLLLSPRQRSWLARPWPWLAAFVAAAVFAPVVVWNAEHSWASFAFQSTQRAAGMGAWRPRYLLQMVGTQLAVATPYLLAIALMAWWSALRGWRQLLDDDARLLLVVSATIPLLLFTFTSLRSMVKPNWLAPAYPPLLALAVQARLQGGLIPRGLRIGLATSATLLLAAVAAMAIPNTRLQEANTWSGWAEAARRVDSARQQLAAAGTRSFVFTTNYKNSALLAFHLSGQPRTYAQDIYGEPALQFDYWPPEALAGQSAILAMDDRRDAAGPPAALLAQFESVRKIDSVVVGNPERPTRRIDLYLCEGYRGHPRAGFTSS
ncbi:MAG TPA: glycosyltransferase family 39 protein [Burkholderiaceae bacterium]|nr:glycosyltransferase family 39 protein [Burkholderiaceae bacterium]